MAIASNNKFPKVILEERLSDGSDTSNPAADHRSLFLGEDGLLRLRDSSGGITEVGGTVADILDLPTAETDDTLVLAPDGAGGVEFRAEAGGGGGVTQSYLGYNTVGGSSEGVTSIRTYTKQITLATDGFLGELEVYLDENSDSVSGSWQIHLFSDSGGVPATMLHKSGTSGVGDELLLSTNSSTWPARWIGVGSYGKWLAAGTYWIGFLVSDVDGLRIYYDGSGSDRYWSSGARWSGDGARYTQTDSTKKYSMRVTVIR